MRIESTRILAEQRGGIIEAFGEVVTEQKKAFIGHLKCMHFLAKEEIAHTTNFTRLVKLSKSLGGVYLGNISMCQYMKYTSERFMQEIVLALGETVQEPLKAEMQSSPVFALLVDTTTDISVLKQLMVYGCYLFDGEVRSRFLGIVELPDGKVVPSQMLLCSFVGKLTLTYTGVYLILVATVLVSCLGAEVEFF